jgi:hypothetical protein
MKEIYTEVNIQTSAEKVWRILTDFKSYPEWNPFILEAYGKIELKGKLTITLRPPDSAEMTFRPTIIKFEPNRELRWLGHLFIPGLFDGEHSFIIEPIKSDQVLFIQREKFTGILVPLFAKKLDSGTKHGFIDMNNAIKKLAEI